MKKSDIIFQVRSSRLSISVLKDLRYRIHGNGHNVWTFPYPSLSKVLRAVEKEQTDRPRHKWAITIDKTA